MGTGGVLAMGGTGRWLIAIASGLEAASVLRGLGSATGAAPAPGWRLIPVGERFDVVVTGVGKGNAAGAVARVLDAGRHRGVLSVGIGGCLDHGNPECGIGRCVLGTFSVYADEGVPMPDGSFLDLKALGFAPSAGSGMPDTMGVEIDGELRGALRPVCDSEAAIATVSECSGTDERAAEIFRRTGAGVEAMEGAAAGFSVKQVMGPSGVFAEVRVVSNLTGDRGKQRWDMKGALARLERFAAAL